MRTYKNHRVIQPPCPSMNIPMEVDCITCRKIKKMIRQLSSSRIIVNLITSDLEEHPLSSGSLVDIVEQIDDQIAQNFAELQRKLGAS